MGMEKRALPTALNAQNKQDLKKAVDEEVTKMQEKVSRSPELRQQTQMMAPELLDVKNDILKKVKLFKMKKT